MSDVRKDIEAIKAVLADAPGPYEIGRDDWLVAYRLSTGPERILRLIEAITIPQAQRDAAQPAGWVLVPKEPTGVMWGAGIEALLKNLGPSNNAMNVWRAMIAAAPEAP